MPDLRRLRQDLGAFADEIRFPLADFQRRALALEALLTAIVAPRQSGKSRALALLAVWWAFRRARQGVLIVSASDLASREVLAKVRAIVASSPLLSGSVVDEQSQLVRLSNGSWVRSVPASEFAIRGHTVDLLLLDEAAMLPEPIYGAALPTVSARAEARIVMASSATRAAGSFYDHAVRGEAGSEHVRTFRWALAECEWISPTVVAAARESMTDVRFAAEYLGEFASGADALFTRHAIERVVADYAQTPLAELRGPARLAAGVDWGQVNDRTVLTAVGRFPVEGERVFGVALSHRWPAGYPPVDAAREIASSSAHFAWLASEANGLGGPCTDELFRGIVVRPGEAGGGVRRRYVLVEERPWKRDYLRPKPAPRPPGFHTAKARVHVDAAIKAAAYSALRVLIDGGRLLLPASAEDLIRELLLLRVDLSASGTERVEASSGHDDAADALALSLLPLRERGRIRVRLLELSDPRRPLPDAVPRDLFSLPTVTAPCGIEVPRTPAWQSVSGPELTLPAEAVAARERRRLAPTPQVVAAREAIGVALGERST